MFTLYLLNFLSSPRNSTKDTNLAARLRGYVVHPQVADRWLFAVRTRPCACPRSRSIQGMDHVHSVVERSIPSVRAWADHTCVFGYTADCILHINKRVKKPKVCIQLTGGAREAVRSRHHQARTIVHSRESPTSY